VRGHPIDGKEGGYCPIDKFIAIFRIPKQLRGNTDPPEAQTLTPATTETSHTFWQTAKSDIEKAQKI
jgi:hypothetical protein